MRVQLDSSTVPIYPNPQSHWSRPRLAISSFPTRFLRSPAPRSHAIAMSLFRPLWALPACRRACSRPNGAVLSSDRNFATAATDSSVLPLAGIRVLDMTRVLAGVCTIQLLVTWSQILILYNSHTAHRF